MSNALQLTDSTADLGQGVDYVEGEVIADKYQLVSPIAQGGMGSVWLARNLALDAQVALKLLRADMKTEDADERLMTEARAAAKLKHPSILRVFDLGRTLSGDPFIVMEYLRGDTLGELLDRDGRLDAVKAVQLLLPIADGLSAAHAQGIVHRDLKPGNLFLSESDGRLQPKIVDFGIARFAQKTPRRRLTQAGTVLGSPDYMSPEQARGEADIDHRTDVWSLCVVLYECLTRRVPFQDSNYNAILHDIITAEIPSIRLFAAGDDALWAILQRGLAKDRVARYSSMAELHVDLVDWLLSHGITEDACGHALKSANPRAVPTVPPSASWPVGDVEPERTVDEATRHATTTPRLDTSTKLDATTAISASTSSRSLSWAPPSRVTFPQVALFVPFLLFLLVSGFAAMRGFSPTAGDDDSDAEVAPGGRSVAATSPQPVQSAPPPPTSETPEKSLPAPLVASITSLPLAAMATSAPSASRTDRPRRSVSTVKFKPHPTPTPTPTPTPKSTYGEDLGF